MPRGKAAYVNSPSQGFPSLYSDAMYSTATLNISICSPRAFSMEQMHRSLKNVLRQKYSVRDFAIASLTSFLPREISKFVSVKKERTEEEKRNESLDSLPDDL